MGYIEEIRNLVGSMPLILNSSGVIIRNGDKILLSYRKDTEDWGIPGGYMEIGESFEETAMRELYEEMNICTHDLRFLTIFSGKEFYHEYPNGDKVYSIIALFLIDHRIEEIKLDQKEVSRYAYFDLHALPDKLTSTTQAILEHYQTVYA